MPKIRQGGHSRFCVTCTLFTFLISYSPFVLTKTTVKLKGAGASFPGGVYKSWIPSYRALREKYVTLDMDYNAIGSTAGKEQIMDPETDLDYAGSDSLLSDEQMEERPDLIMFPTMAGAVVIGYNLPDLGADLVLSIEQLAGIYNGSIQFWNDTIFKDLNPNATFPDQRIITVARADGSGTTEAFTSALSTLPSWKSQYGVFSKAFDKETNEEINWKPGVVTYYGMETRGMSGVVMSFAGSIGYLSAADAAEIEKITYAKISNSYGQVVEPDTAAVQSSMEEAARVAGSHMTVFLTEHQTPMSYPIATYTYFIVSMTNMKNCDSATELVRYIYWFLFEDIPRKESEERNMVPLSETLRNEVLELILKKMTCQGMSVWEKYEKQLKREEFEAMKPWLIPVLTAVSLLLVILGFVVGYFVHRRMKLYKMLARNEWYIPMEDIIFYSTSKSKASGKSRFTLWPSVTSLTDIDDIDEGYQMMKHILQWPGKFGGNTVGLRLFEIKGVKKLDRSTKKLILWIKDYVYHQNVLKFYGLSELQNDYYVVSEFCSKGSLSEVLKDSKFTLNKDFKFSLSLDIATGLAYLHSKDLIHGHLSSFSCVIDFKWTVKIADWEYWKIYTHRNPKKNPLILLRKNPDSISKNEAAFNEFWTAPEIVKSDFTIFPSASSDIFSYSIIVQEIFTRKDPYSEHYDTLTHDELLKAIINNHLRPTHGEDTPLNMRHVMESCWSEDITRRPTTDQLLKMLRGVHSFKKSVLDTMMEQVDEYAVTLEERLHEKDAEIQEMAHKLRSMAEKQIPPHLQQKLGRLGRQAEVEQLESVSVIAMKLCLSPKLISTSNGSNPPSGRRILEILRHLENRLSHLVHKYKAFRLDYSSGIYTVVCGLGRKDKHQVTRAASLALDILDSHSALSEANEECTEGNLNDDSADNSVQTCFQLAVHKGHVHAGIVNNGLPRCFMIGEAMETVHQMLLCSGRDKILVSKPFHDVLMPLSEGLCVLEENQDDDITTEQNTNTEIPTYWMKRWPTPTPPESPSLGSRQASCDDEETDRTTMSVSCQTEFSSFNGSIKSDENISGLPQQENTSTSSFRQKEENLMGSPTNDDSVSEHHVVVHIEADNDFTTGNDSATRL